MALIPFPNVPNSPGVPLIPRSPNFPPLAGIGLGVLEGIIWRSFQINSRWGIFDSQGRALGNPQNLILESIGIGSTLSTASVEFAKETRVSDFPLEKGGFASYNKVELPAEPIVTLNISGSDSARQAFLNDIDKACKSTDLYDVVTPEITYKGYSIERYNYQRKSERGCTLLRVEIGLKEVREVSAKLTKAAPKQPSAQPQVDNGKVQAQQPDVSTLKSITDKVGF